MVWLGCHGLSGLAYSPLGRFCPACRAGLRGGDQSLWRCKTHLPGLRGYGCRAPGLKTGPGFRTFKTHQEDCSDGQAETLEKARAIAHAEGKQLQAIIEEALLDLIEKRQSARPPAQVMALYQASVAQNKPLYEQLSM